MSPRPNLMAVFQDGPLTNSVRRDPNLVRPGGNLTGFTSFEFSIGTKWLEALKQTAPRVQPLAWPGSSILAPCLICAVV